jgi:pilus assembly protein CpaE
MEPAITYSQATAKSAGSVPDSLKVLLIATNAGLAADFRQVLGGELRMNILEEVPEFPTPAALDQLLAARQPDIVFLDISGNPARADEQVRLIRTLRPQCLPVALHTASDPVLVVDVLKAGAADILFAPFSPDEVRGSIVRLRKRLRPESTSRREARGRVVAFVSAKPGSGASTLASQAAFALKRITGQKVLLADFNLRAGTSHCWLDPRLRRPSLAEVSAAETGLDDPEAWAAWTVCLHGVDLLPSPPEPVMTRVPRERMEEIIENLRRLYDWVVVDLPSLADETTLTAMTLLDEVLIVTTTELASLHLAHRLRRLIEVAGVGQEALRLVVNRVRPNDVLTAGNLEKSLRIQTAAFLPNDYFALHAAAGAGPPLVGDGKLAAGIKQLASSLCHPAGLACAHRSSAGAAGGGRLAMALAR